MISDRSQYPVTFIAHKQENRTLDACFYAPVLSCHMYYTCTNLYQTQDIVRRALLARYSNKKFCDNKMLGSVMGL